MNPPSWFGRIYSLKMNILPRILYLCHSLTVTINMSDLTAFQNKMLSFIWGDKKPRVNKSTLFAPKTKEGLVFPDLIKYFYAV